MAVTESTYTGNGSTTNYSFTFPYLKTTDIKTSINGTATTAFTLANATTVQFNTAPANSAAIRIYRETDDSKLEATFFAGSAIKSSDLNDNFNQNLYVTQESNNKIDAAWTSGDETITSTETWVSNDNRVSTTAAQDARIDTKIDTALTTDVAAGNKITVTDNSPGSGQITVALTSGSLVNSDVNASAAIAGTKVDPQFGTQNVSLTGNITVSGTVDGRDVSADGTKLDTIETAATADQTNAEIRTAVEAATDSNVFTDADHSKLNAIEASATADQTDAEIRTAVEAASDSNVFTDADHSKLNAIEASATADQTIGEIKTLIAGSPLDDSHLAANSVGDSEIVTGALDNRYYTKTTADARYFNISTGDTIKDGDAFPDNDTTIATTAAINDRIIDLVDDVGGFVPIANETSFPNANPDVNNGAGTLVSIKALSSNLTSNGSGVATIANGTVGNSTVTITGLANSTTYSTSYGMIVETTTTLNTYTFHRQVPIATEVSTVASNIANVNAVGNNISNVNTVAGNTTNINTVSGANTNITTVSGSIANVNTVATNITNVNDFSDKYRVASSAPSSNNDTGDLYYDTSSNELRVYNGSAWQGGVTATGNLASLGANTFTGAQTFVSGQAFDGRDVSVDGAKLDGIEAGATADQTNAEIRAAVEAASDSNVFTDADHTKLNAIEASATADQTDAEIRAAVEAASDSHVFTDADHTKLNSVESGATADQTKSEIEALNINADTVDGIHGASFVRSDVDDTINAQLKIDRGSNNWPLVLDGSGGGKLLLTGSTGPYIQFQEGTTNKAYIYWSPSTNALQLANEEDSSQILLRDDISFSTDGSTFHTMWHAGNDGAGSGLDADTLDGVQGASYLRSDTSDAFTSGALTINGMEFHQGNVERNLKLRGTGSSGNDVGLSLYNRNNAWTCQLYGTSGHYGFLDGNWGNWDLRKVASGIFEVDEGSGLQRVINAGNVGSGGALSSSAVYLQDLYCSNWVRFTGTDMGLYHSGNNNYLYSDDAGYWTIAYNGSSGGLRIRDGHNGTIRAYLYANDSNDIGFLNYSGSWILRSSANGQTGLYGTTYPVVNNSYELGTSSNKWSQVHATTYYGDGSNLTGISSAPEYALTASGSVSQGDALVVNASGNVEKISETITMLSQANTYGGPLWYYKQITVNGQSFYNPQGMWEPISQRLISGGWRQQTSNNARGYMVHITRIYHAYSITESGNNVPMDSRNEFVANGSEPNTFNNLKLHSKTGMAHNDQGTCVFTYLHYTPSGSSSNDHYLGACAGTIQTSEQGGRWYYGTAVNQSEQAKGSPLPNIAYIGSNKFLCYHGSNTSNSTGYNEGKCSVLTLSGDKVLTWTSMTGALTSSHGGARTSSDILLDKDSGKCVVLYSTSSGGLRCTTASVSGTSVSFSSSQQVTSDFRDAENCCRLGYDPISKKTVAVWIDSNYKVHARVIDVSSNNSFSLGTSYNFNGNSQIYTSSPRIGIVFDDFSKTMWCTFPGSSRMHTVQITSNSSNNNLTITSTLDLENGNYYNYPMTSVAIPQHGILADLREGSGLKWHFRKVADGASNISSPLIGFAKNAASNGGSVTVQLTGSVQENQAGLSAGSRYYPSGDGTLQLYQSDYYSQTTAAGVAISPTKLAINISY